MADISNKTLAFLLVVAIVISVGGAMINISKLAELTSVLPLLQITGFGTSGTVNITINSTAAINLTFYQIDFGPGTVIGATARLNSSSSTLGAENWSAAAAFNPGDMLVENVGNQNVSLNFTSDKNATGFIGGTSGGGPRYQFKAANKTGETNACTTANLTIAYTDVNISAEKENDVCKCFRFEAVNDEINISAQVFIPDNTQTGAKNSTWTFIATAKSASCT